MITYFEEQLEEFVHSVHSLDMDLFERWVSEAVNTLRSGKKIIVSGLGMHAFCIRIPPYMETWVS